MVPDSVPVSVPGSLVHPLESNPHESAYPIENEHLERTRLESSFRHSGWWRLRERIHTCLMLAGESPHTVQRFAQCGSNAWILRSQDNPDRYRLAAFHCKHRFCLACQRELRRVVAANLLDRLDGRSVRFITLTVRHMKADPSDERASLNRTIDHLYASFQKLRRTAGWKAHVTGGVAFLEIKATAAGWHPHLHILVQGRYFPQKELSHLWFTVTGDSYVVDIRDVSSSDAVTYTVKYCTKINVGLTDYQLIDLICALRRRRTFTCFGCWTKWHLTTPVKTDEVWEFLYPLHEVIAAADRGELWATRLLHQLSFTPYMLPDGDFDTPPD